MSVTDAGTLGTGISDAEQRVDFDAMRKYKLDRIQAELEKRDWGALVLYDCDNIRYASSTKFGGHWARDKNMKACIVPREADPIICEMASTGEVKRDLCPWIKPENIRPGVGMGYHDCVLGEMTPLVAAGVKAILEEHKVADMPIGLDSCDVPFLRNLDAAGLRVENGWEAMYEARLIKCKQELQLIEMSAGFTPFDFRYASRILLVVRG